MREIKFRGKRKDNNEWVYGYLQKQAVEGEEYYITYPCNELINYSKVVIPETIGQYTGLKDKNDVEIYEGDIIEYYYCGNANYEERFEGIVKYKGSSFMICEGSCITDFNFIYNIEVIGNIYEVEHE